MAKALEISDELATMLAEADKAKGFPAGTMYSIMMQESGGNSKYLNDPSAYHYGVNKQGKRVAKHTGKVSTAFGPFGLLESTAKDPGYGVKPLRDKSIGEQIRFAADYLAARAKKAGGLVAGMAGYGEGKNYAQQVAARVTGINRTPKTNAPQKAAPTPATMVASAAANRGAPFDASVAAPVVAQIAGLAPEMVPVAAAPAGVDRFAAASATPGAPAMPAMAAMSVPDAPYVAPGVPAMAQNETFSQGESVPAMAGMPAGDDPWQQFLKSMPQSVQVADLNYSNNPVIPVVRPVSFGGYASAAPAQQPSFNSFMGWKGRT